MAEQQATAAELVFDYPFVNIGTAASVTVAYDPSLRSQGLALAQGLLGVTSRNGMLRTLRRRRLAR